MKGRVFRRCTACGSERVNADRRCLVCGATGKFSWAYRVDVGRDEGGRRRRERGGGYPTKEAAERGLREVLAKVDSATYVPPSELTLGDFLLDEWLPATAPPRVSWGTYHKRRGLLETYVVPRIGAVPLQDLNSAHCTRLYAALLRGGKVGSDRTEGLAVSTVHDVHRVLRKALSDAQRWGLVERNATDLADAPPVRAVQAARRKAMTVWTVEELRRFLESVAGHRFAALFEAAAATGLRRSELLGLRWADVDLDAATLAVDQTLTLGEDAYELDQQQKSSTSGRTIHLDSRTVDVLRRHRQQQLSGRLTVGEAWQDRNLVFCDELGRELSPPAISQAFRRAVEKSDLPRVRLHDLRHTHATLLLRAGANPKVVSERLGHSSVAFTLDTYSHVIPGMQPEAAEMYSRLVFGGEQLDDIQNLAVLVGSVAELLAAGTSVEEAIAQVLAGQTG